MPRGRKGYTTPHRCATVGDNKRNRPSHRDLLARCRLQEKVNDIHTQFQAPIYLGLGIDAETDIYYQFSLDQPISFELDSPSAVNPPLI